MQKETLITKISSLDYTKIKNLIKEGKYTSVSHFVRTAIKSLIKSEYEKVVLDDEIIKYIREALEGE